MFLSHLVRQNITTLAHSLASLVLFTALGYFFAYMRPDPDYNDLLSVLIGALVTIVTVMFSAVLVALQLASAQFSPRITRAFFGQNRKVQAAFYLFLFGIAYCFAVKFTYSTALGGFRYHLLPVSGAMFGFFLISFVLPRFVFYIADAINAASIAREISLRTIREIDELYGTTTWKPTDAVQYTDCIHPKEGCLRIRIAEAGFLDTINHQHLNQIARQYPNLIFYCELIVGNFVTTDETALKITVKEGQFPTALTNKLLKQFVISKYRSYDQDVLFGVRQLVDMGIKAISPAVNDPSTCVNCLHYLGVIVRRYAKAQVPSIQVRNAPENLHFREFNFEMLLNAAFDQIYQWGRHDYMIVSQLLNTFTEILQGMDNPHYRQVVAKQVAALELDNNQYDLVEHRERVNRCYTRLKQEMDKS